MAKKKTKKKTPRRRARKPAATPKECLRRLDTLQRFSTRLGSDLGVLWDDGITDVIDNEVFSGEGVTHELLALANKAQRNKVCSKANLLIKTMDELRLALADALPNRKIWAGIGVSP
jgi:hypothetical protein